MYETYDLLELLPIGIKQKSFYGKAKLLKFHEGNIISLLSYNTIVCEVINGKFITKFWDGYSATTLRHVNALIACTGADIKLTKKQWQALKVDEPYFIECLDK